MFVSTHRAVIRIAVAAGLGTCLILVCACAQQGRATTTPTEIPSPTSSRVPMQTPSHAPNGAASEVATTPNVGADGHPSYPLQAGPVADLTIQSKTSRQANIGTGTVFTLTIHNLGPDPATGIVLTDVLPSGAEGIWTQTARPLCDSQERTVSCDLGSLGGRDAATITLDLSVKRPEHLIEDTQLAGVAVDFSSPVCALDHDRDPPVIVCYVARLESGAEVHLPVGLNLAPGLEKPVQHTASVTANEGDGNRANNRVTSILAAGIPPKPAVTLATSAVDLVLDTDGPKSVIAGEPFTYTFTITNHGTMMATRVTFQDTLPPATDLEAFEPESPPCAQDGDTFTCHLRSPASAQPVTITTVITGSAGQAVSLGLDPLAPGWPSCAVIQERSYLQLLQCHLGTLKQGEVTRVEMMLIARGIQERTMVNTARVDAGEEDLESVDNSSTTTITVRVEADLAVLPWLAVPETAGGKVSYSLNIANLGPSDAEGVVLTDNLPAGVEVVSAIAHQGEGCQTDASNNRVTCRMGRIDSGKTATASMVIAVERLTETFTHYTQVQAQPFDPNSGNNELTESILLGSD